MAKCDVCGKNSLLPERFGEINVCKICFIKANGPFWKHQYDRHEDAEKHRCKTLETIHKQNFPQPVVSAINDFFITQMNAMLICDCCGLPVQHRQPLGKANICKDCFNKINTSAWKATEYEDNQAVEKNREKVLKIAAKNNFPPIVVDGINSHFDSKIQQGLVCVASSSRGQKLKVYETHCVLTTTDSFDVDEISKEYGKVLKKMQPKESLFSNSAAKSLARSVLSGGFVKAGINLATSAAINVAADAIAPEKGMFKVVKGQYRIDYFEYDYVDFQKVGDNEIGFIRFRNSKFGGKPTEDIIFFFGSSSGMEETYNEICKWMEISRKPQPAIAPAETHQPQQGMAMSAADEILKFKQLLDMGVITQEEFDAKKKQILGL